MSPIHLLRAAHAIIHDALMHAPIPATSEASTGAQSSVLEGMRLYASAVCALNWVRAAHHHKHSTWRRLCRIEQQMPLKVLPLHTGIQRKRSKANRKLSCTLTAKWKARSNGLAQTREERHAHREAMASSLTDDVTAYVTAYAAYQHAHKVAQQATQETSRALALLVDWLLQYQ
jgi:hypothetical protein